MKKSEKTINIMTSCDEALAKYVSVMLQSISDNLTDANVRFFLLHSKISSQSIDLLARQCSAYNNLEFHSIIVDTPEIYEKMAIGGGGWCGEAYYSLGAYKYLPADVDRILYLDAADTLVTGNIDDYYFSDFEGMSLIATAARYKVHNNQLVTFNSDDLTDSETLSGITRGIFNSGSYVMNIEKMRQDDCGVETYLGLANMLQEISGNKTNAYWGDQGLLSVAFIGDMKFFGYPQIRNLWYMPYNFCLWFFDRMNTKPDYQPSIAHYAGAAFKPWLGNYPVFSERFQKGLNLHSLNESKLGQAEYFYMWHEYAIKTEQTLQELGL